MTRAHRRTVCHASESRPLSAVGHVGPIRVLDPLDSAHVRVDLGDFIVETTSPMAIISRTQGCCH